MKPPRVLIGPKNTRFSQIEVVAETGSTNTDLLSQELHGDEIAKVLVTEHQTSGRGRDGRTWIDNPGESLLISVMSQFDVKIAPLMPFVAGLAIVGLVTDLGAHDVGLKWPNDVVVKDRKLAGILVEAQSRGEKIKTVIGCGINLTSSQQSPAHNRAISVRELTEKTCSIPQAANYYLYHLEEQLALVESDGIDDLLLRYSEVCVTLGQAVRAEAAGSEIEGIAESLGVRGELLIQAESGDIVAVDYGDVHLK